MKKPYFLKKYYKQKEMLKFYRQFINENDLCFDIGANIGERTDVFLKLKAKVVCVEPQSRCIGILSKKYHNNNSVSLIHAAIGSEIGSAELMLCNEYDECSTLSNEFVNAYSTISNLHWGEKETVKVVTIESLCKNHGIPKLCKIDIEGYELEAFKGMKEAIEIICFEFNKPLLEQTKQCLDLVASIANYECNFIEYENMELKLDVWLNVIEFKEKINQLIRPEILTGEIILRLIK